MNREALYTRIKIDSRRLEALAYALSQVLRRVEISDELLHSLYDYVNNTDDLNDVTAKLMSNKDVWALLDTASEGETLKRESFIKDSIAFNSAPIPNYVGVAINDDGAFLITGLNQDSMLYSIKYLNVQDAPSELVMYIPDGPGAFIVSVDDLVGLNIKQLLFVSKKVI